MEKNFRNDLLKRSEVSFDFVSEGNPGDAKVNEEIVSKFKVDANNVVLKRVKSNFGRKIFSVEAFIYDSVEDKDKVEAKKKVKEAKK